MNCPYCAKEMESGYLRGGSGYELLWTEEPFKMTSLPAGNDFFVCKASDVYRPIAHLCLLDHVRPTTAETPPLCRAPTNLHGHLA